MTVYVRLWHKADMLNALTNVCLGGKADIDGAGAAVGGRQKLHQQTDIKVPRISRVFRTHFSVKFMTRYAAAFHIRGQVKHRGKMQRRQMSTRTPLRLPSRLLRTP
ncbi:MAG: hypothetical protein WBF49_10775 [Methyloceanibacter sp.]